MTTTAPAVANDDPVATPAFTERPDLLACAHCAAVWRRPALGSSQQARCPRCDAVLGRGHRMSLQGQLALALAALIVLLMMLLQPVVELNLRGLRNVVTLPGAIGATWAAGEHLVAVMAAAAAVLFPLAVVGLRLYVTAPLVAGRVPPGFAWAMDALHFCMRWSMVEVLLLSALVSVVRIAGLAGVRPAPALFAFGALALLMAATQAAGEHRLWEKADALRGRVAA